MLGPSLNIDVPVLETEERLGLFLKSVHPSLLECEYLVFDHEELRLQVLLVQSGFLLLLELPEYTFSECFLLKLMREEVLALRDYLARVCVLVEEIKLVLLRWERGFRQLGVLRGGVRACRLYSRVVVEGGIRRGLDGRFLHADGIREIPERAVLGSADLGPVEIRAAGSEHSEVPRETRYLVLVVLDEFLAGRSDFLDLPLKIVLLYAELLDFIINLLEVESPDLLRVSALVGFSGPFRISLVEVARLRALSLLVLGWLFGAEVL